jgi:hypothetical protein
VLKPHQKLTSSPVEVYARELGNAVPVLSTEFRMETVSSVDKKRSLNERLSSQKMNPFPTAGNDGAFLFQREEIFSETSNQNQLNACQTIL